MSGRAHRVLLATHHWLHARPPLFPLLKVALFGLLALTSALYIRDDLAAASRTLDADSDLLAWLSWFAISIDYVAWYGLLLLYELQTSWVDDERLRGPLRWAFNGLAMVFYLAVFWALAGYLGKLRLILDIQPPTVMDLCTAADFTWMQALDRFVPVSREHCLDLNHALTTGHLYQLGGEDIVVQANDYWGLGGAWSLAWADAVEGVLWIVALGLIQLEIVLQLKNELGEKLLARLQSIKVGVYGAIILVTLYYSFFGRVLDLYDSVLWLLAFLFIEINITDWNEEARAKPPPKPMNQETDP